MPSIDRRGFMEIGAAAAIAGAGGLLGLTKPGASPIRDISSRFSPRLRASPGFYRFTVGDYTVTVLGDGSFQLPSEILGANIEEEQLLSYLDSRLVPSDFFTLSANPALIDAGDRLVLVDTGTGGAPPTSGRIAASLAAAGVAADAIDVVIVTHAHPDHVGGLLDEESGDPQFPNAEVVFSDTEHAFWAAEDVAQRVPGWVTDFGMVEQNHGVFSGLGDRIRTVPMEGEIVSGIHSVPSPGHTPGHIAVQVSSSGEQLMLVGDAIFTHHTHFEHPDWEVAIDLDQAQAARTRRRLLDRIATDRMMVQGFHLPFPGVGHAISYAGGFRWLPAV